MPTVHVRGVDLHYEEYGRGPCLVVAHGLLGSVELAARFGDPPSALAEHGLRVIAYDARGHGRSGFTEPEADYTWASHAADLVGLIRALGLPRTSLLGGSMGAGTALLVALEHPDLVERLVLVAPPPFGADLAVARRAFLGLATLYRVLGSRLTARLVTSLPPARRAQRQNPRNDLLSFFAGQRRAAVVPAIRGLLRGDSLPAHRFGEIGQEALVLAQPDDPIHPVASGELLRGRLRNARLDLAPRAGWWQEHAAALTREVGTFLTS